MKLYFANKLVQYFPELKDDVNEYLEEYDEVYLHLIFGDIFNPYFLELLNNPKDNYFKLIQASELIENMAKMDIYMQEVVATTILERLFDEKEKFVLFRKIAGVETHNLMNDLISNN